MWSSAVINMLVKNTGLTLYMTLVSTVFAYILGLPMGIALVVTAKEGLRPNKVIYKVLDIIVNVVRSVPFLILLILVIPLTRAIVGKAYVTLRQLLCRWCWQQRLLLQEWWSPLCLRWTRVSLRLPRVWEQI